MNPCDISMWVVCLTWPMILVTPGIYAIIEPLIVSDTDSTCPVSKAAGEAVRNRIDDVVYKSLSSFADVRANCGEGSWHQIANLNMTDPSHHCPPSSGWLEVNNTQDIRGCQKLSNASDTGCQGTMYPTYQHYSRVCGRATGYQIGGTAAFGFISQPSIDTFYHYGLSLTHGMPRTHIWSFAIGLSDGAATANQGWECPCNINSMSVTIPSFIGDDYFCESGNPTSSYISSRLYGDDPVWDGMDCESEGQCCSTKNSPPWFNVDLPSSTTDDVEVRLCIPTNSPGEGMVLQKLEIYIQ